MRGWIWIVGALALAGSASALRAQGAAPAAPPVAAPIGPEVTLIGREGPLRVTGRIRGYDGDVYAIDTAHGALTLDAAAVTCEGAGCPDRPSIAIEGDGALAGVLMPALIEAFAARRGYASTREAMPDGGVAYRLEDGAESLRIALRRTGSEAALASLADGRADLALSMRAPRGAEVRAAREGGAGDIAEGMRRRVLALDALVPVVSPRNPVRALGLGELAALFSGEVADWAEVGGAPGPVALHLPEAGGQRGPGLRGQGDAPLGALALRGRDAPSGHGEPVAGRGARPGRARRRATLGDARLARPLALRGPCGLVVRADPDAVRAGDWPLTLPLGVHLPARPLPRLARELVAFATSPQAQRVVRRAGLLDQAPHEIPLGEQGDRLAAAILSATPRTSAATGSVADEGVPLAALRAAVADLRGLTRLTPTFRFERGVRLDAPSREAVERLAARIASGALDGRRLVFVGFGDATGSPERNLALSRRRAEAVLEAVRARLPARDGAPLLSALGHGEALPLACDDTALGRRLNRRVELWVE